MGIVLGAVSYSGWAILPNLLPVFTEQLGQAQHQTVRPAEKQAGQLAAVHFLLAGLHGSLCCPMSLHELCPAKSQ